MVVMNLVHGQMGFIEHVVVKIATIDHTIAKTIRLASVKEIVWVVGHVVVSVVAPIDDIFVKMVANSITIGIFCNCE